MSEQQQDYWIGYYKKLTKTAGHYLDYSNERVQAQSFAAAIEATGAVFDARCLDVGCGRGLLSCTLRALGAAHVVAIDVVPAMIESNRLQNPDIDWRLGDITSIPDSERFDRVLLIEMLQYVPVAQTIKKAWRLIAPGGRLVAVVPNRECPIVQCTISKFNQFYSPPTPAELMTMGTVLPEVAWWGIRGMNFQQDQTLCPYSLSEWTHTASSWNHPPNRLQFAACKR